MLLGRTEKEWEEFKKHKNVHNKIKEKNVKSVSSNDTEDFLSKAKKYQDDHTFVISENGSIGYATSGKALLDLNFKVSSLRAYGTEEDIRIEFNKAYAENPLLSIKWLFFAGDIRGGMGERKIFKICFNELCYLNPEVATLLIEYVPEYNRWDSLLYKIDTNPLESKIISVLLQQLNKDLKDMEKGENISLLSKWMPSINTSSKESVRLAYYLCSKFRCTPKEYRQTLSKLRKYLDVVEVKTSSNKWSSINYNTVPSKANLKYKNAFMKHDEYRRNEYLSSLNNGEENVKINAGTLYPHDIILKYRSRENHSYWYDITIKEDIAEDIALENLWKNLKDYGELNNVIVVRDGSASMLSEIDRKSELTAADVCDGLTLYYAERCKGSFKNKFITFSRSPRIIDLSNFDKLYQKLNYLSKFSECENTNIEGVFDLILNTAVENNMKQEDIPSILIISDMEFDYCTEGYVSFDEALSGVTLHSDLGSDFEEYKNKFKEHGYKLPMITMWNVAERSKSIPIRDNELGVHLVSGFSPAITRLVLSGKVDPYDALVETLNVERYRVIEEIFKSTI